MSHRAPLAASVRAGEARRRRRDKLRRGAEKDWHELRPTATLSLRRPSSETLANRSDSSGNTLVEDDERSISSVPTLPLRSSADISDVDPLSPWARKNILSLDGGGVRGYSSLLILKALMDKVAKIETSSKSGPPVSSSSAYPWGEDNDEFVDKSFRPCHYFDFMAGTSTGGLSAIMLGRLEMSVEEALGEYEEFGNAVFGHPRRCPLFWPRAKYSSKRVESAVKNVISKHSKASAGEEPFAASEERCRIMVVSRDITNQTPYIFRSYARFAMQRRTKTGFSNPGPAHVGPIWKAARATSAAPTYFDPIYLDGRWHEDGGLGTNNPEELAYLEVDGLFPSAPSILLSLGTGEDIKKREMARKRVGTVIHRGMNLRKVLQELLRQGKNLIFDTEKPVHSLNHYAREREFFHLRLNVTKDLGAVKLDEWKYRRMSKNDTLEKIRKCTQDYILDEQVQADLERCAKQLVKTRRWRAKTVRWERFATDVQYHCPYCPGRANGELMTREQLYEHIIDADHIVEARPDDEKMNKGRETRGARVH